MTNPKWLEEIRERVAAYKNLKPKPRLVENQEVLLSVIDKYREALGFYSEADMHDCGDRAYDALSFQPEGV
jgi:hypothetical protein